MAPPNSPASTSTIFSPRTGESDSGLALSLHIRASEQPWVPAWHATFSPFGHVKLTDPPAMGSGAGVGESWFFQNASSPAHTPKNTVKKARQMTPRMQGKEYAGGFGFGGVGGIGYPGSGGTGSGLGLVEVAYMGRALEVCRTQVQVCYRAWYAR